MDGVSQANAVGGVLDMLAIAQLVIDADDWRVWSNFLIWLWDRYAPGFDVHFRRSSAIYDVKIDPVSV